MELLAVNLDLIGILVVSTIGTIGVLLVSYAIAGWYERRARRRRQSPPRAVNPYGGFWIRFVAYLIDSIIIGIPVALVQILVAPSSFFIDVGTRSFQTPQITPGWYVALLFGVGVTWLYFALLESSSKQATLGKNLVGLTVTRTDGSRLSFIQATGRHLSKILNGLTFMVGYIMIGLTSHKQGLHDMLAKTLVCKKDALPETADAAQDQAASSDQKDQKGSSTASTG